MIGQFDPSNKSWISGKGRTAVWTEVAWDSKLLGPQYLMAQSDYLKSRHRLGGYSFAYMKISSATNSRTLIGTVVRDLPSVYSICLLKGQNLSLLGWTLLSAILNSTSFDFGMRLRLGGLNVTGYILRDTAVCVPDARDLEKYSELSILAARLSFPHVRFATEWSYLKERCVLHFSKRGWRHHWAVTPHERLRLRAMLDGLSATLYGLSRDEFAWVLKDCDHSAFDLSHKTFCHQLDPKGFWRFDKGREPELRQTTLSLAAFDALQSAIAVSSGNREAGIKAFCEQNDGDGWMLPENLCIADLGLTRTVNIGDYDERARSPQPVRSRMGERFLDWQLAQTVEDSWAECERHASEIALLFPADSFDKQEKSGPVQGTFELEN